MKKGIPHLPRPSDRRTTTSSALGRLGDGGGLVEPSFPQILLLLLLEIFEFGEGGCRPQNEVAGRGAGLLLARNVGRERSVPPADVSAVMAGVSGRQ